MPPIILDEAYMQQRNQRLFWQSWSDSYRSFSRPDTTESLREEFALSKITYEEFERRLERCLRLI